MPQWSITNNGRTDRQDIEIWLLSRSMRWVITTGFIKHSYLSLLRMWSWIVRGSHLATLVRQLCGLRFDFSRTKCRSAYITMVVTERLRPVELSFPPGKLILCFCPSCLRCPFAGATCDKRKQVPRTCIDLHRIRRLWCVINQKNCHEAVYAKKTSHRKKLFELAWMVQYALTSRKISV